jgi:hypothetical protein
VDLLIGVAVLALVLYRQLQKRPVRDNVRLPLIFGVIGVIELVRFLQHGHHGTGVIIALAGSLGTASLLLYLGVTFTIQRLILQARAQRIPGASPQNTGAPTASW